MSRPSPDTSWFPPPPVRPPKAAPTEKLLLAVIVPVAVAGGLVAGLVGFARHHAAPASTVALAAYVACVRAHGGTPAARSACARQAGAAFAECMRNRGAAGPPRPGRLGLGGGLGRSRTAAAACRSLVEAAGIAPAAPGPAGGPAAPVA